MAASKPATSRGEPEQSVQPLPEQIRVQLDKILSSKVFIRSERLCRFLRVTVERVLAGEADKIKEYTLGRDVFDRDQNYDPRVDSIVRVEARRLRRKLREYYKGLGTSDPVSFEFPPGAYVPIFRYRTPAIPRLSPPALPELKPLNPRTVAVLPFINLSSDPGQDFFCDGITEEILNTLTTVPQLNVVARTSVFRYKERHGDVREIGRQLHAGTVIEGSVRKSENQLRISAQVIDASKGILLWSGSYDRELTDVFAVQDEIARAIADSLHVTLATHLNGVPQVARKRSLEAFTLLLKGRHFWNQVSQEGTEAALSEFTRAIAADPGFAPPYAALAEAYAKITFWGGMPPEKGTSNARQAALRAIQLDPMLADAYAILGIITSCHDWNWPEGSRLFAHATELQPSNMNALTFDALQLVFQGKFREARVRVDKTSELDPVSPCSLRNEAWYWYFQRQYNLAKAAMRSALALDPDFREGQFLLAYAYLRDSRYQDAVAQLIDLPEGPYSATKWGALGEAYACSGDTTAAVDALSRIDALASSGYVSPISRAWIYAGLRDWDRVFEQFEKAYLEHTFWLSSIKVDPRYDAIRDDPRMVDLLRRMNLAAQD